MPCLPLFPAKRVESAGLDDTALECYRSLARSALGPILSHQVLAGIARICKLRVVPVKAQIYTAAELATELFLVDSGTVELYKMLDGSSTITSRTSHASASGNKDDSETSVNALSGNRRTTASTIVSGNGLLLVSPKATPAVSPKPTKLSRISFRTLQTGHWFGQCAALGLANRQCSARALTECRVLSVEWEALTKLLDRMDCDDLPIKFMLGFMIMSEVRRAAFFHGMRREEASLLSTLFHPRFVPANAVLFEEGETSSAGPSMFFCSSGKLTMHQSDSLRGAVLLRTIEKDQFFGEACSFFRLARIATVRATTDCWIAELPFAALSTFLGQFSGITIDVTCAFNQQHIPAQHLLTNPVVMAAFAKFVALEASLENLEFWTAARRFRLQSTRNKALLLQDARALYDKFVVSSAARQVNLPGPVAKTLQSAVEYECVTRLTFEEAELEVLRLMDSDTFARFKVSSAFEACLEQCRAEQHTQSKQT